MHRYWFSMLLLGLTNAAQAADTAALDFFESKVRPLLIQHCQKCHGDKKQQGGLRLDIAAGLRAGGDSGAAVIAGKPTDSLLIKAINHDGLKMPNQKMPAEQIAILTEWVKRGAFFPETKVVQIGIDIEGARKTWWAFQPVRLPAMPAVKAKDWPRNAVDYFILAAQESRGLKPTVDAERRTLVRRATFDLTGLPPSPDELDAALSDASPDWFAKVVERLLASPAYGERWGRHWLDLVRYADTAGDNSDFPVPQLYKYRNWVIAAFNADKPYDAFLREQLAGDLVPARSDAERNDKLIATGYLANARRFGSGAENYPWHLTIEDTIDNLGRTVLGLTINCTRCHDHKFDPLTNEDYYALYGFFASTRYPFPGIELDKIPKDLVPLAAPEVVQRVSAERRAELAAKDAALKQQEKDRAGLQEMLKAAEKAEPSEEQAEQVKALKKSLEESARAIAAAKKEREAFAKQPLPYEVAYAVVEQRSEGKQKVGNVCIQIKGDPEKLGKEVPRRFPTVLGGQTLAAEAKGSGRLELAQWLTDAANPLTARVMVNRIWQQHFGRGIVATPSDFGKQGQAPTHPELLDYLAARFVESGWSIKAMHRTIMLSRTYQLASQDDGIASADVANDYLSRFRRHRLDAESIRDALLTISGRLDRSAGGAHPFPAQPTWNFTQHNPFKAVYDTNRRSVYLMTQRIQRHPFLGLFDGADTNASTSQRITSTTALQALYLMNDPFVRDQAGKFAARLLREDGDASRRLERAYLLAFGRPPSADEQAAAQEYLHRIADKLAGKGSPEQQAAQAWTSLVRALLLSNEFVYVE